MRVRAYACSIPKCGDHETIVNAESPSKARYRFMLDVGDAFADGLRFQDVLVRSAGAPVTTERFLHNAKYRGIPDARCGDRVTVGGDHGIIVGHNDSANLDVLFEDGPYSGQVLNVHPGTVDGWRERVAIAMVERP